MIREYVSGQKVRKYIRENGFDDDIARELTELIKVLIELKFARIDIRMREVFVTEDKKIKMVDPACYLKKRELYPRKMLRALDKLGCKDQYMDYLKENEPKFYNLWVNKT